MDIADCGTRIADWIADLPICGLDGRFADWIADADCGLAIFD
jgi:hypothetical protein